MTTQALVGIEKCPRCSRSHPSFTVVHQPRPVSLSRLGETGWNYFVGVYSCNTCLGSVLAESDPTKNTNFGDTRPLQCVFPEVPNIAETIPEKPRRFLSDAQNSLSASSASIMASCSAIDAMLKERDVKRKGADGKDRSLYKRIEVAVDEGILTKEMADWAHKVRLDANDQRHADEDAELPSEKDAKNVLELARTLAEILFVVPAKLKEAGRQEA